MDILIIQKTETTIEFFFPPFLREFFQLFLHSKIKKHRVSLYYHFIISLGFFSFSPFRTFFSLVKERKKGIFTFPYVFFVIKNMSAFFLIYCAFEIKLIFKIIVTLSILENLLLFYSILKNRNGGCLIK
jgi:hypothetical protein